MVLPDNSAVFLSIAVAVLFILYLLWQQVTAIPRASQVRSQIAALRGWSLQSSQEPNLARHAFGGVGPDGTQWTLEGVTRKTSDDPVPSEISYTRWFIDGLSSSRQLVAAGPSTEGLPTSVDRDTVIGFLREAIIKILPDASAKEQELLATLKEVSLGGVAFKRSYLVFATSRALARKLMSEQVEAALVAWMADAQLAASQPTVVYWRGGLQIRIAEDHTANLLVLDRLVALGELLAATATLRRGQ